MDTKYNCVLSACYTVWCFHPRPTRDHAEPAAGLSMYALNRFTTDLSVGVDGSPTEGTCPAWVATAAPAPAAGLPHPARPPAAGTPSARGANVRLRFAKPVTWKRRRVPSAWKNGLPRGATAGIVFGSASAVRFLVSGGGRARGVASRATLALAAAPSPPPPPQFSWLTRHVGVARSLTGVPVSQSSGDAVPPESADAEAGESDDGVVTTTTREGCTRRRDNPDERHLPTRTAAVAAVAAVVVVVVVAAASSGDGGGGDGSSGLSMDSTPAPQPGPRRARMASALNA